MSRKIKDIFKRLLSRNEYVIMEIYEYRNNNGTGIWVKVAETEIGEWTTEELTQVQKLQLILNRRYEYVIKKRV